jgi:hypothetical protein
MFAKKTQFDIHGAEDARCCPQVTAFRGREAEDVACGAVQLRMHQQLRALETTPVGFEPTRGDPISLAGRRLNHSAKVSSACCMAQLSGHHDGVAP